MDRAIELTKFRTHQFARHQETWFRGLSEVNWIERRGPSPVPEIGRLTLREIWASLKAGL